MLIKKFCIFSLPLVPGKEKPRLCSRPSLETSTFTTCWEHGRLVCLSLTLFYAFAVMKECDPCVWIDSFMCFSSLLNYEVMRTEVVSVWLCSPIPGLTFAEWSLEDVVEHQFYIHIQQLGVCNMEIVFHLLECSCFSQLPQNLFPRQWSEVRIRSPSPHQHTLLQWCPPHHSSAQCQLHWFQNLQF